MTRVVSAIVVLLALTACSSTGSHASGTPTSTSAPGVSPAQAAQALATRLMGEADLPADALRSSAPPAAPLATRQMTPAMGNLVGAFRMWTTNESPAQVQAFVIAHVRREFTVASTNTDSAGGVQEYGVVESLRVEPPDVSDAELQVAAAPGARGGSIVRVDALVGWTEPKPADELVASADRVAVATRAQGVTTVIPAGRVVVVDPAAFGRLRAAFDGLRVSPPGVISHCPAITEKSYTYTVAFAASEEGSPDVVATFGTCGGVSVVAAGKTAPRLDDSDGTFSTTVSALFR